MCKNSILLLGLNGVLLPQALSQVEHSKLIILIHTDNYKVLTSHKHTHTHTHILVHKISPIPQAIAVTGQLNNSTESQQTTSTVRFITTHTNTERNDIPIIAVSVGLGTSLLLVLFIAVVLACLLVKHKHKKNQ